MNVAIVGSTGLVGRMFLQILEERSFSADDFFLYASGKSDGKTLRFFNKDYRVQTLERRNLSGKKIDLALFSAGADVSREFAKDFTSIGATVVDNSSAFRMSDDVPLVVPEVNPEDLRHNHGIVANPNCSTIILSLVLKRLDEAFGLRRVIVSTYQAVSGAGKLGIDDLRRGENGLDPVGFPCPIYSNCIPQIDALSSDGYTKEELKLINETKKILHRDDLEITATAVRVPVYNTHAESVNVELNKQASVDGIVSLLSGADGISVKEPYPTATDADGRDNVFVGRIRRDLSKDNAYNLWIVGDNLRKGAALNAVQIAELVSKIEK